MKHFRVKADINAISNWTELGNALHVSTKLMAYSKKFRDKMQRKIRLGKRTVYSSASPLSLVQKRLSVLADYFLSKRPYQEVAIAYRTGLNVHNVLSDNTSSALMIKTDIVHFYDNISFANIQKTLQECGMCRAGARLVASYSCVWNGRFSSLQQGSSCSPAIANLVGNRCLDVPIMRWLESNCTVEYRYYRYSDNLVLFCKTDPGREFVERYKQAVKDIAAHYTFKTHSWSTIANNHPTRHQEFLGVVLNETANIYKAKRDWLRAVLFNTAAGDIPEQGRKFFERTGGCGAKIMEDDDLLTEKFTQSIQGYISYANTINATFALKLAKMLEVIKYRRYTTPGRVAPEVAKEIGKYSDINESLTHYFERIRVLL